MRAANSTRRHVSAALEVFASASAPSADKTCKSEVDKVHEALLVEPDPEKKVGTVQWPLLIKAGEE